LPQPSPKPHASPSPGPTLALARSTDPAPEPGQVSSAVFPARAGEEGLRFRNEPAAPDPARQSAGMLANGWAYRLDSGGAQEGDTKEGGAATLRGSRASKSAAGSAGQASQVPEASRIASSDGEEGGLRRRRQSPHDSPLLSAALGLGHNLGGSMEELEKIQLPMDGHMPGFKDA
jgi:hypothetical protein